MLLALIFKSSKNCSGRVKVQDDDHLIIVVALLTQQQQQQQQQLACLLSKLVRLFMILLPSISAYRLLRLLFRTRLDIKRAGKRTIELEAGSWWPKIRVFE